MTGAAALLIGAACSTAAGTPASEGEEPAGPSSADPGAATVAPDLLATRVDDDGPFALFFQRVTAPVSEGLEGDEDFQQLLIRDAIKPIYTPGITTKEDAQLDADDLVMGVSVGGVSRAYPINTMRFKEIVNDELGGTPILVTWCTLCYTGRVHDRRVDGETLLFGNQRALFKGALTWWDWETLKASGLNPGVPPFRDR